MSPSSRQLSGSRRPRRPVRSPWALGEPLLAASSQRPASSPLRRPVTVTRPVCLLVVGPGLSLCGACVAGQRAKGRRPWSESGPGLGRGWGLGGRGPRVQGAPWAQRASVPSQSAWVSPSVSSAASSQFKELKIFFHARVRSVLSGTGVRCPAQWSHSRLLYKVTPILPRRYS